MPKNTTRKPWSIKKCWDENTYQNAKQKPLFTRGFLLSYLRVHHAVLRTVGSHETYTVHQHGRFFIFRSLFLRHKALCKARPSEYRYMRREPLSVEGYARLSQSMTKLRGKSFQLFTSFVHPGPPKVTEGAYAVEAYLKRPRPSFPGSRVRRSTWGEGGLSIHSS